MKKVIVINPNTSNEMTASIKETVERLNSKYEVTVVNPPIGPESLESFYDYEIAASQVLKLIKKEDNHYDGILLSCFGDPGLYALKEISRCPVVGIAEASISTALLLGKKFSVLTALSKAVPMMKEMVYSYGIISRLASVRAVNCSVLEIEGNKEKLLENFIIQGRLAVEEGAEVIILGCASMTGLKDTLHIALGIPVIDPVEAGYKALEALMDLGLNTSKAGLYAEPPVKNYKGEV